MGSVEKPGPAVGCQKTNLSVATRSSVGWGWGAGASVENRLQRREGSRTESAYLSLTSAFGVSEGTSWPPAPNSRTMEGRSVSEHRSYPASVRLCTGEPGSSGPPSRRRLDGHWTVAGCVGRAPTSPEGLTQAAPGLEGPANLTATTWERSQASTLQR